MPLYQTQETSNHRQVILISTDMRGPCPIVSLLMPAERAKQIVAALDLVDRLASVTDDGIDLAVALNVKPQKKDLKNS